MKRLLMSMLVLYCLAAKGQEGVYLLPNYQSDENCCVILTLSDNRYIMEMNYMLSDDNSTLITLSIGNYSIGNCQIKLIDELFGFEMKLQYNSNLELTVVKGFYPMINSVFEFSQSVTERPFMYLYDNGIQYVEKTKVKRVVKGARNEKRKHFSCGLYAWGTDYGESGENVMFYSLHLDSTGYYQYRYRGGIILSEGRWRRRGNLLILQDVGMKKPIFAIVREGGIESLCLPGAYFDGIWPLWKYAVKYD